MDRFQCPSSIHRFSPDLRKEETISPECDVPVLGIVHFFGTGIGTNWYRKKSRNRYRNKFGTGKSLGTGIGKIWYRKKVSEPVSEKFYTGTDFRCQNLGILKIYNGYRYRIGTGTENFSFFWWYRNRYRKNLVPEKSLGTGIGQIWYQKKVSEPVSEKFGTEKSTGIGIENI